jgi:hypothetical protein
VGIWRTDGGALTSEERAQFGDRGHERAGTTTVVLLSTLISTRLCRFRSRWARGLRHHGVGAFPRAVAAAIDSASALMIFARFSRSVSALAGHRPCHARCSERDDHHRGCPIRRARRRSGMFGFGDGWYKGGEDEGGHCQHFDASDGGSRVQVAFSLVGCQSAPD